MKKKTKANIYGLDRKINCYVAIENQYKEHGTR